VGLIEPMSNRIEIVNGDEGWRLASRLLEVVWSPEVVATLPWKDVVWARADSRVLKLNCHNDVIGHAGIYLRDAEFDARPVKIGGVGGVATRLDFRQQGIASEVMREAVREMRDKHGVDFGLLFCEPRHAPLYKRLGWRFFEGEVFVEQPRQGRVRFRVTDPFVFDLKIAPRGGILDLCGLPW
jgi:aminoglycoside 2'-N-acetyltransferase I